MTRSEMKRGILGVVKDPKKKVLFSIDQRFGDNWPSSDSEDSDYEPDPPVSVVAHKRKRTKSLKPNIYDHDIVHHAVTSCDSTEGDLWGKCIPELVLLKIFRYVVESDGAVPFLCHALRVCRLWYQCASSSALWKTVDLSYGWIKANDATIQLLCQTRFSKLTSVNLSYWKSLTANGLKLLADTCPQLKSINMSGCRVNAAGVLYMINKCSSLANIDLMSYGSTEVTNPKIIVQIVSQCAGNLRSLNLSRNGIKGFSAVVKALASYCPNLECLDLSQNHTSYIPLSFDIEHLQRGCSKLHILRLVNTVIQPARVSIRDRNESPGFPELQELCLGVTTVSVCPQIDVLQRLVKTSKKLQLLDLRGWSQLNCADLENVPATDLAYLYISGIAKDDRIEMVASRWQHSLVELDVSWNIHSESALDAAMKKLASNSEMSKLKALDLTGTQILLESVKSVLQGCPVLCRLNLSSCRALPRGMKREYLYESLDQLRKNVDHC